MYIRVLVSYNFNIIKKGGKDMRKRIDKSQIVDPRDEDGEYAKVLNEHTLPNYYNTYYVDPDGTEIMTLDTFIKTEMARRNLTLVEFCKFVELSAPSVIKLRKQKPSDYVYYALSGRLKINLYYLSQLPITEEELREMYYNDYNTK